MSSSNQQPAKVAQTSLDPSEPDGVSAVPATTTTLAHEAGAANETMPNVKPTKTTRKKSRWTWVSWLKVVVFLACLAPLLLLVASLFTGNAGANPIETVTHVTGEWGLRFLLLGLVLTPLRWLLKSTTPIRFRRMIGLFAFFYVALHVAAYAVLDQQLDVPAMLEDLFKRPYIIAGFVATVLLIPLAITSTRGMMRRLGKRWLTLHKAVYLASIAAVVHFIWLAKGDQVEPKVYAAILAALLGARIWRAAKRAR